MEQRTNKMHQQKINQHDTQQTSENGGIHLVSDKVECSFKTKKVKKEK